MHPGDWRGLWSGDFAEFSFAVLAEFSGAEVADEAGVDECGVNAGFGEEVIDEEFVGILSGEVGAHIEGDAAECHSFEEL